jgi:hypothetical protein
MEKQAMRPFPCRGQQKSRAAMPGFFWLERKTA